MTLGAIVIVSVIGIRQLERLRQKYGVEEKRIGMLSKKGEVNGEFGLVSMHLHESRLLHGVPSYPGL